MEKDIGKISKNDTTDVVIRVDDFGGRKGVTIREFVTSDRYTGFTKQGVRIQARDFPKFREMINSVTDEDLEEESMEKPREDSRQKKLGRGKEEKSKEMDDVEEEMPDY
jgi:hypothetical protein